MGDSVEIDADERIQIKRRHAIYESRVGLKDRKD